MSSAGSVTASRRVIKKAQHSSAAVREVSTGTSVSRQRESSSALDIRMRRSMETVEFSHGFITNLLQRLKVGQICSIPTQCLEMLQDNDKIFKPKFECLKKMDSGEILGSDRKGFGFCARIGASAYAAARRQGGGRGKGRDGQRRERACIQVASGYGCRHDSPHTGTECREGEDGGGCHARFCVRMIEHVSSMTFVLEDDILKGLRPFRPEHFLGCGKVFGKKDASFFIPVKYGLSYVFSIERCLSVRILQCGQTHTDTGKKTWSDLYAEDVAFFRTNCRSNVLRLPGGRHRPAHTFQVRMASVKTVSQPGMQNRRVFAFY